MRFLVDENLPREAADLLRAGGHDAVTAGDVALGGHIDADVAAWCRQESRALLTLDVDFANTQLYPPGDYKGLVVLRLDRQDKPHVLSVVAALIPKLREEDLLGKLWVVDEDRIRIR